LYAAYLSDCTLRGTKADKLCSEFAVIMTSIKPWASRENGLLCQYRMREKEESEKSRNRKL
jgi:hypothetical protein